MIDAILPGIVAEVNKLPIPPTHLVAATDDLFALTLLEDGGLDHLLRRLVAYGMDPVLALRCATYNAAYRLQRADLGAGRRRVGAPTSSCSTTSSTFAAERGARTTGGSVAADGRMLVDVVEGPSDPPLDTMRLDGDRRRRHVRLRLDVARRRAPHARDRRRGDDAVGRDRRRRCATASVEIPDGHIVQVTVHRHGRIARGPARGAALGLGRLDRRGRHHRRARHAQPRGVRARPATTWPLAANTVIASGGGRRGGARRRGARAHRAADRGHPLAVARGRGRRRADAPCRTPRSRSACSRRSLTQPLFQVMLSSLACLPGPHVTDVGLIDGTTGEVVATALDLLSRGRPRRARPRSPARVRFLSSAGAPDASIEHVAMSRERGVVEAELVPHELVLLEQVRPEQQRVVGVEAAPHAGREQRRERVRRDRSGTPTA